MSTAASPPTAGTKSISSPGGMTHRQILTILSGLMLGMFLAALDQTIVATSIRTIADDLHGLSQQAWATTAYLITSTIATPLYGKLSDLHGRKPYYLIAITVFVVGSAACTFSTSMTELAAFRAFQGIGAGGLMSLALAILGDIVPPRERARYQGYLLGVFATSSVLGPLIGGFLAGQNHLLGLVGWRWVFLVNVPVGVIALLVVAKVLNIPHTRRNHRIDIWGAVAISAAVVPLLIVAEQGREWGWWSTDSIICYAIGLVGMITWVFIERWMGDDALIPMRLFRNATFSKTGLLSVLIGMGMFGGLLLIPQYLQIVKGASPTKSGLEMVPLMVGMMIASILSGQVTSKTGRYKAFPIIGTALMVVTMVAMALRVQWDTPLWETMLYMLIFGIGLGFSMQPIVLAVQNAVPPRDMGVATASSTFFRQMGATAGTAVFLSVLFSNVGGKIIDAFTSAATSPAFLAATQDPSVRANPVNRPVLEMLKAGGTPGGGGTNVLNDSSFIQKIDPRLAQPFKVGFSNSMHVVFFMAAAVMVVCFLLTLIIKEVPLRQVSGLEALAAADAQEAADAAGVALEEAPDAPTGEPVAGTPEPEPEPSGIPVRGSVRDGESLPVAGAVVTLIDVGGQQLDRADADSEGHFVLAAPGAGTYVLIGSAGSRRPQAATVVVGESTVELDLTLSGSAAGLTGTVLDDDGSALSGALVVATDFRGEVVATGAAGDDGAFAFKELVPGSYTLAVSHEGHRPTALPVEVAGATPNWYEVQLAPGARVSGTVRTADGRPLDDARVTLLDPTGNVVGTATTGPDGEYGFTDLSGGEYTVIASGYAPIATPVHLEAEGRDDFDVDLGHETAG